MTEKVENAISYLHATICPVVFSAKSPLRQPTNELTKWLAELDAPAWRILMCPPWHDHSSANHRRERLLDAQHKLPPAISLIIPCAGLPLHQQPDAEQSPRY